jgi:NitT/TauT family transport system substrate-binding protein
VFVKAPGFKSLYGSSKISDDFNVKYGVYKKPMDIDKAIDSTLLAK